MGRIAEGWKLRTDTRTKIKSVRFRHEGVRYDRSTGERDHRKAREKAAAIYASIVSGNDDRGGPGPRNKRSLVELFGEFLQDIEGELTKDAHYGYTKVAFSILEPSFERLENFTTQAIAEHCRKRLKEVLAVTVKIDLKVMRRFFAWCVANGVMKVAPEIQPLAVGAVGVKANKRKSKPVHLTAEDAAAILAALPERSKRHGFPVRARFAVQWETSLRQATISRLRVPDHYRRGSSTLVIDDPIDKARFGRTLPLTDAARAALDSVCPDIGLIFGRKIAPTFKPYLLKAAKDAGLSPEKAEAFSAYDLRHGRITDLLTKGAPLPAVAYLAGHTLLTTTNRYVQVAQAGAAAAEALRQTGGVSGGVATILAK